MDEETGKIRVWKIYMSVARAFAISLRITGAVVAIVMLLWTVHRGFELASDASIYTVFADWAFYIGVLTMIFGFLFLILGIPIVADLCLNLSKQMQEEAGIQKAREPKTISETAVGFFATLITIFMLWWTIYTGIRLTTEPRRDSKHHHLTTSIGAVTIAFGLIYFIIGLAITAELAVELIMQLQQMKKENTNQHLSWIKRVSNP